MKPVTHIIPTVMVLTATCACLLMPMTGMADASSVYPYWIDDIKGAIAFYKGDAYYK